MKRHNLPLRVQAIVLWMLFGILLTCCVARTSQADGETSKPQASGNSDGHAAGPSQLNAKQQSLVNRVFASRLLEIASEYEQFARVDQTIRWSPGLCFLPPDPPRDRGSISTSGSQDTHGKKLYYLYARKPWQYRSNIWGLGADGAPTRAPLGQVLVKEAWQPVEVRDAQGTPEKQLQAESQESSAAPREKRPYAVAGAKTYHAGEKNGLYIMFKTHESTPGTDQGWVYGTTSADGKHVTSVGLVKNCMECHRDAPHDRQIGLPSQGKAAIVPQRPAAKELPEKASASDLRK